MWKQKAENQFIKLPFFLIGTSENYRFVRTFNQLHKIFPSDITKAGKKISILPGLVAFGLISCVGSYLSRPWDNENGSLHITKILLISCSLKVLKNFTLFIFTFWASTYWVSAWHFVSAIVARIYERMCGLLLRFVLGTSQNVVACNFKRLFKTLTC